MKNWFFFCERLVMFNGTKIGFFKGLEFGVEGSVKGLLGIGNKWKL